MRQRHSMLVILLSLMVASAHAQKIDRTTGRVAGMKPGFTPLPEVEGPATQVLWDLTHGVYVDYEPTVGYTELVAMLASNAYAVSTTAAGIDNVDLAPYDILVICLGSAWDSPYTASEVTAIQSFVASGKGVLVMADNANTPNANINPITQAFGTTCGVSTLDTFGLTFSNFAAHPIFSGVSSVTYANSGELDGTTPSIEVAFTDTNQPTVTVVGPCSMVVTGDISFCIDGLLTYGDNEVFTQNIFDALAGRICTVGVQPSTWGALKVRYR